MILEDKARLDGLQVCKAAFTLRAALRSGALRGTAQRRAAPRSAAQRRAALRSVARCCAASRSAARHCAALPASYLCKSYANEVNNQHRGHGSVFHRFLHAVTTKKEHVEATRICCRRIFWRLLTLQSN